MKSDMRLGSDTLMRSLLSTVALGLMVLFSNVRNISLVYSCRAKELTTVQLVTMRPFQEYSCRGVWRVLLRARQDNPMVFDSTILPAQYPLYCLLFTNEDTSLNTPTMGSRNRFQEAWRVPLMLALE